MTCAGAAEPTRCRQRDAVETRRCERRGSRMLRGLSPASRDGRPSDLGRASPFAEMKQQPCLVALMTFDVRWRRAPPVARRVDGYSCWLLPQLKSSGVSVGGARARGLAGSGGACGVAFGSRSLFRGR